MRAILDTVATQTQMLAIVLASDDAASFATVDPSTHQAILVCETNAIRWRADGTAPTRSGENIGTLMASGDSLILTGADYNDFLKQFQIINAAAGSNGAIRGAGLTGINKA